MSLTNIKVFYPSGEIRRFGVELPTERECIQMKIFSQIISKAINLISENKDSSTWNCLYMDPENDWINLDKEEEFLECIKLSKGEIKLKFTSKVPMEQPIDFKPVVEPTSKYEPIKVLPVPVQQVIHTGVICDKCNTKDFSGIRYKCKVCKDYDMCEKCWPVYKYVHNHPFEELLYPHIEQQPSKKVHWGVTCDGCQMRNIEGKRYKCLNCQKYDLCESCFDARVKRGIHFNNHVFRTLAEPESINVQQQGSSWGLK
jgi:hypothetical protein